jgi:hypothetical protein
MRSRSSLPEAPPSPFARRNLRPEFLVQSVGFFCELRGWQRLLDLQDGFRNIFAGVTELGLQVLLDTLGTNRAFLAERRQPFIAMFGRNAPVSQVNGPSFYFAHFRRGSLTSLGVGWKGPREIPME